VLFYVLIIAMVNLCLGYAVGVYLGFGLRPIGELEIAVPSTAAPAVVSADEGEDREDESSESDAADESEQADAQSEPPEPIEKSDAENSINELRSGRDILYGRLVAMHDRLRASALECDKAMVASFMEELKRICAEYVKTTDADLDRFASRTEESDEMAAFFEEVQKSVTEYSSVVEANQVTLASVFLKDDPKEGCRQVFEFTSQLLNDGYRLRDRLAEASIGLARREGTLGKNDGKPLIDELAKIPSREAAETAIEDFWHKDPHRNRKLTIGLVDLDNFDQINENHGTTVGDRLITAVAQLLSRNVTSEDMAARFQGQRFLVLFPDNTPRHATTVAETIRQTIEETAFEHGKLALEVTASCAVSQSAPDDTIESIFERLMKAVQEAKRYGRNRTFLHDGKYPAPVVPPNLNIKSKRDKI